jgi:hypothetical protein
VRYRKKPVVIDAMQLLWTNWSEMCEFADVGHLTDGKPEGTMLSGERIGLNIPTLEGLMTAQQGDWIIRGVKGELYPCKPDIFEASYEPVEDEP